MTDAVQTRLRELCNAAGDMLPDEARVDRMIPLGIEAAHRIDELEAEVRRLQGGTEAALAAARKATRVPFMPRLEPQVAAARVIINSTVDRTLDAVRTALRNR